MGNVCPCSGMNGRPMNDRALGGSSCFVTATAGCEIRLPPMAGSCRLSARRLLLLIDIDLCRHGFYAHASVCRLIDLENDSVLYCAAPWWYLCELTRNLYCMSAGHVVDCGLASSLHALRRCSVNFSFIILAFDSAALLVWV